MEQFALRIIEEYPTLGFIGFIFLMGFAIKGLAAVVQESESLIRLSKPLIRKIKENIVDPDKLHIGEQISEINTIIENLDRTIDNLVNIRDIQGEKPYRQELEIALTQYKQGDGLKIAHIRRCFTRFNIKNRRLESIYADPKSEKDLRDILHGIDALACKAQEHLEGGAELSRDILLPVIDLTILGGIEVYLLVQFVFPWLCTTALNGTMFIPKGLCL